MNETRPETPAPGLGRRDLLRGLAAVAALGCAGGLARRAAAARLVWQIDPDRCVQCGRCATHCVMTPSAVKCVHAYSVCGYCDLCGGYHRPSTVNPDSSAENQLCPMDAIRRTFIEDPYYEYRIVEELCIGCGRCVKGCGAFGNGSLYLQVRHDRCVNCNQCTIAAACPAGAFIRLPAEQPYVIREVRPNAETRPPAAEVAT